MSAVPEGLEERGERLWKVLDRELGTAEGEVALEACRIADRLDRFARLLTGDEDTFRVLEWPPGSGYYSLNVASAATHARQHAVVLKALLDALGGIGNAGEPPAPTGQEDNPLAQVLELVGGGVRAGAKSAGSTSRRKR